MSTTHITPTIGRIVYYRGADNVIRPAIVTAAHGPFCVNLYVLPSASADTQPCGAHDSVTHADPEQEPGCVPSWHWMPYQKQQAEKHSQVDQLAAHAQVVKESAWKPSDTSEAAIEREIQAKGLTAPRLSPADLDANIEHTEIVKHVSLTGQVLRWAILTTRNGFAVVGKPSVAVSPANDNAEIGEKVAIDNSRTELWPLMGYALKQQLHEATNQPPAPGAAYAGYSTMPPHQQRVVDEKCQLDARLAKLIPFFDTPIFADLAEEEKQRLERQEEAMKAYSAILAERITAFTIAARTPA